MKKIHVADNNEARTNVRISKVDYRMPSGEMEYIPLPEFTEDDPLERAWFTVVVILGIAFFAVIIGGFIPR